MFVVIFDYDPLLQHIFSITISMTFFSNIKQQIYPLVYQSSCVDNAKFGKSGTHIPLPDEVWTKPLVRGEIISSNGLLLDAKVSSSFIEPCLERFSDVTIDYPHGFAYVDNKLICPPGWSLKNLFKSFPIKSYLAPSSKPLEDNYDVEAFYSIGPTCHNYYHWTIDKLVSIRSYLYYRDNYNSDCKLLCPYDAYPAIYEMLQCFGLSSDDLIRWDNKKLTIRGLVVSSSRKSLENPQISSPEAVLHVQATLMRAYDQKSLKKTDSPRKILVSRRDAQKGRERFSNTDELSKKLIDLGFEEVSMTGLSFFEQVCLFNNADVIVGVHGAALTNIMFCKRDCKIIEIIPTNSPARFYTELAGIFELDHQVYAISPSNHNSFTMNVDEFLSLHMQDLGRE